MFLERGRVVIKGLEAPLARRPVWLVLGLFALGLGVGVGLAVAAALPFGPRSVTASHSGDDVVHACVNRYTGQARIIMPGRAPNCTATETQIDWAGGAVLGDLGQLSAALEDLQEDVANLGSDFSALNERVPACLSAPDEETALFEGCNVQITNGLGGTGVEPDGTGNLIIGYNEANDDDASKRNGSHNLVVGPYHSYDGVGGVVAGYDNAISGTWSTITGGQSNTADGTTSVVVGGAENNAFGEASVAVGGYQNTTDIDAAHTVVVGGQQNVTGGPGSVAVGGWQNSTTADAAHSVVLGGVGQTATLGGQIVP